jgi:hypothetical protein
VLVASARFAEQVSEALPRLTKVERKISVGGEIRGFVRYGDAVAPSRDADRGRVRGRRHAVLVRHHRPAEGRAAPRPLDPPGTGAVLGGILAFRRSSALDENDRSSVARAALSRRAAHFTALQHRIGGTGLVMERFDPEKALRCIERHRVTTSQWVPTHFIRLLKLPDEVRARHDLSSLKIAIHAAAPCPVPIKQAMIEWWGPKIVEYYAGTEGGGTLIRAEEWLAHPGSSGGTWPAARSSSSTTLDARSPSRASTAPSTSRRPRIRRRASAITRTRPRRRRPTADACSPWATSATSTATATYT